MLVSRYTESRGSDLVKFCCRYLLKFGETEFNSDQTVELFYVNTYTFMFA